MPALVGTLGGAAHFATALWVGVPLSLAAGCAVLFGGAVGLSVLMWRDRP